VLQSHSLATNKFAILVTLELYNIRYFKRYVRFMPVFNKIRKRNFQIMKLYIYVYTYIQL